MSRSNFARSQSKVWFGNEPEPYGGPYGGGFRPYGGYAPYSGPMSQPTYPIFHDLEEEDELIEEQQTNAKGSPGANSWAETDRQGSPASHKSQVSAVCELQFLQFLVDFLTVSLFLCTHRTRGFRTRKRPCTRAAVWQSGRGQTLTTVSSRRRGQSATS